jgi:hypothetical protein
MDLTPTCPACGAPNPQAWPGLVAPFIAELVLHEPPSPCSLLCCGSCAHLYFDRVFTQAEAERLYRDYRGATYFEIRHRHEPWYTEAYNRGIGHDASRVALRRAGLSAFLWAAGLQAPLGRVLDYGGDSGQLIPEDWAQERFVHDLSDVPPVAGVQKLQSEDDLRGRTFELVLLAHVLEHVSDLAGLLGRVRSLLPDAGGKVYVEVPLERPWTGFLGRGPATGWYLERLRTRPRLLRVLDFYSSAFRIKAGFYPPLGFPKLHEHLHFFSSESLRHLLARAGFRVLHFNKVPTSGQGRPDAMACLVEPVSLG